MNITINGIEYTPVKETTNEDNKPKFEVGDKVHIKLNGELVMDDFGKIVMDGFIDDIIPNNGRWLYIIDDFQFSESHLTLIES